MPRKKEPLTRDEREEIKSQRAALREKEELAALEDAETERKIKAGEIPDPDSTHDDFINEDDDESDGDDDEDESDQGDDDDGDIQSSDGHSDEDDEGDGNSETSGENAGRREGEGEGGDGGERLASTRKQPYKSEDLAALSDEALAAAHLEVVGREPTRGAKKSTLIRNILNAQATKG